MRLSRCKAFLSSESCRPLPTLRLLLGVALPLQQAVLAGLISPQGIKLLTNLLTEVVNLLRVDLPHFAVQVSKPGGFMISFINQLTGLITTPNFVAYQGLT